jgi:hypothetical protein
MAFTRGDLTAVRAPDGKTILIKTAANPTGGALATHWLTGPHAREAIGNAALDTQRAALYDLSRALLKIQSTDPEIVSLQRDARAISFAIARQIKALQGK